MLSQSLMFNSGYQLSRYRLFISYETGLRLRVTLRLLGMGVVVLYSAIVAGFARAYREGGEKTQSHTQHGVLFFVCLCRLGYFIGIVRIGEYMAEPLAPGCDPPRSLNRWFGMTSLFSRNIIVKIL